ncbi:hypothetical protein RI054_14g68070 [Pseudoscourfieldia marina]
MPTINAPGRWDVFISHSQRDANATTLAEGIFASLKERGLDVWLDVKMNKRDVAAMEEGAKNATMVIAIVTDGGIIRVDKDDVDTAFFRRDFCLKELRWAKSAGAAIQPVIRVEDKKRVGEFIASAPDDLKDVGEVDWVDLNRGAVQYWNVGMDILVQRLEEARKRVRQPAQEAAGKNGMRADALALLEEMHLDKYADALFKEGVVTATDLSLVDDEIMDDVGFSKLEKKKFLKHRPSSARPTSRAPESDISTVRRGQAAIDSFKARGNWRKLANVRDAATRLHILSVDATAGRAVTAREKAKEIESYRQQAMARESAKTSTGRKAAIESIKEAEGRNNVHAIIETMKLNAADADVQEQACRALWYLSNRYENVSRIGQAGGIEAVVSAMKRHQDHAGVQESACGAVCSLSVNNDENQSRIGQAGGIEALISTMKRHENHAGVQERACLVFYFISRNAECKRRAIDAGAIPAIEAAKRNHPNDDEVQTEAARALGRLGS